MKVLCPTGEDSGLLNVFCMYKLLCPAKKDSGSLMSSVYSCYMYWQKEVEGGECWGV
jgi:hypothetical protein